MGWSIGYDSNWKRDIGYGVPAYCDHPGCMTKIDRGLSYVCGGEPYGGEHGCGLFFCGDHRGYAEHDDGPQRCDRCLSCENPFTPTPDHPEWIEHKLTDDSWRQWRDENPEAVVKMRLALAGDVPRPRRPFNTRAIIDALAAAPDDPFSGFVRYYSPGSEQHRQPVQPLEIWLRSLGIWVRADASHAGSAYLGYHHFNIIDRFRIRRAVRRYREIVGA